MSKNNMRLAVTALMMLSLVLAACGKPVAPTTPAPSAPSAPPAPVAPATPSIPSIPSTPTPQPPPQETANPAAETPKYGGTLTLSLTTDLTRFTMFDSHAGTSTLELTNEKLEDGDWAKGTAGGFGTKETLWDTSSTDVPDLKAGFLASKPLSWTVDADNNSGTIIIDVRQGVHWALDPTSAASRAVNGREMTADDIVHSINYRTTNPQAYVYLTFPDLRNLVATKTGPWQVSLKMPLPVLLQGVQRLFNAGPIQPPELDNFNYGRNWRDSEGTGPFILKDYIPGSSATLVRNANYWGKDPVGPGKGNQLPYLDGVKFLIIPDASTRQAALRTGKVDQMGAFTLEDANQMKKTTPALANGPRGSTQASSLYMRTDLQPFNDLRVRQALMMGIDFNAVNQGLYGGLGQVPSWPYWYESAYSDLYLGLDDNDMPAETKALYTYSPDKAKQLLKDAGYPNGLKTNLILASTDVDYYSIIKDMWAKIGVDVTLDVREANALTTLRNSRNYPQMITYTLSPPSAFRLLATVYGVAVNQSMVDDPVVNEAYPKVNLTAITDMRQAMKMTRELTKYVGPKAWVIGTPRYPSYTFWWPWLKNYSGENSIGYAKGGAWAYWIWYDQALKKSMGY